MVKYSSIFSQLLSLVNRVEFQKIIQKHEGEKHSKGFGCWDQFVAMLFCQMAQAKSIREICTGLACCIGKMKHLGIKNAPKKSTLSYANAHRPCEIYEDLFYMMLERCRSIAPGKKFRFKNKLLSLDSSTSLSMFEWAQYRRTKGAVKLHLLLDHDGYLPAYAYISNGKKHDVTIARHIPLSPGSVVAMDRGYNDYKLFAYFTENGIFFVTRQKENAVYEVISRNPVPKNRNILSDELIRVTGFYAQKNCPHILSRIVVRDGKEEREIVLLTNHLKFGATTTSDIYKDRWQIELFFKALKQNLKVKTFIGTSENALRIQIWTALIAMLIIKYLKFISKISWALSNLVALLHWNLFTYRDLREWLNDPYQTPPLEPGPVQQRLFR